jgi:hypothetical protein
MKTINPRQVEEEDLKNATLTLILGVVIAAMPTVVMAVGAVGFGLYKLVETLMAKLAEVAATRHRPPA